TRRVRDPVARRVRGRVRNVRRRDSLRRPRWRGRCRRPLYRLLALARRFDRPAMFVTITTLGGRFGFDACADTAIGQAGALGFTKALAREWPTALVKAIDADPTLPAPSLARTIVGELTSGDRTVEVGFGREGRVVVSLRNVAYGSAPLLGRESAVLVTGGARGVGLVLARSLAEHYGCAVALGGRSGPDSSTEAAIDAIRSAGARACSYRVIDVRDPASVRQGIDKIRLEYGRLDGLVHAAGVRADAPVRKKNAGDMNAVVETKVA